MTDTVVPYRGVSFDRAGEPQIDPVAIVHVGLNPSESRVLVEGKYVKAYNVEVIINANHQPKVVIDSFEVDESGVCRMENCTLVRRRYVYDLYEVEFTGMLTVGA